MENANLPERPPVEESKPVFLEDIIIDRLMSAEDNLSVATNLLDELRELNPGYVRHRYRRGLIAALADLRSAIYLTPDCAEDDAGAGSDA